MSNLKLPREWTSRSILLAGCAVVVPFLVHGNAQAQDTALRRELSESLGRAADQFTREVERLVQERRQELVELVVRLVEERTQRLQAALAEKERRIADLERRIAQLSGTKKAEEGTAPAISEKTAGHAFLGVSHIEDEKGARVTMVHEKSPAAAAGLQEGDLIIAVNGNPVTSETLGPVVQGFAPGAEVTITYLRGDEERKASAMLANREEFLAGRPVVLGVVVEQDDEGVFVHEVEEGYTGAAAGLEPGDRITHVNGDPVKTLDEIAAAVGKAKAGNELALRTVRDGRVIEVVVIGAAGKEGAKLVRREPAEGSTPAGQEKKPAYLGVELRETDGGLLVTAVLPDSAARAYGVRTGDVIRAAGEQEVRTFAALEGVLRGLHAGDKVRLTVRREGQDVPLDLVLGARGEKVESPEKDGGQAQEASAPSGSESAAKSEESPRPGKPGTLGVQARERSDGGVEITFVYPGSAAEKAGIQGGDVLVKVGEHVVASFEDLFRVLTPRRSGDTIRVRVVRGDKELDLEVTLGEPLWEDSSP